MIKTRPVLFCNRCGKPVVLTMLATQVEDPDGSLLHEFMQNIKKITYCDFHQKQRSYYASQNRLEDWEKGLP